MEYENLLNAIRNEFRKHQTVYFEYAWREKIGEFLEAESKYERLVDWINKELELWGETANVFNPADRNENTTLAMVNKYQEIMGKIAVLVHCKELLLDSRTTTKMRDNIEYTLCKLYKIHYSEELKCYV